MTPEEAIAIAQPVVDRMYPGEDLVVFFTEDMDPVYLGHFNTRRYVETRNSAYSLGPGPGPIAVPKDGSEPWSLGSAPSFAEQVARRYGAASGSQGSAVPVAEPVAWGYGAEPRLTWSRWFRRRR